MTPIVGDVRTASTYAPEVSGLGDLRGAEGYRSLTSQDAAMPRTIAALLSVVLVGCLAGDPTAPGPGDSAPTGMWVFHVAGGNFDSHVQVVSVSGAPNDTDIRVAVLPSRDWQGSPTRDLPVSTASGSCGGWTCILVLHLVGGETAHLHYAVTGDNARGEAQFIDSTGAASTFPILGFRIDTTLYRNVTSDRGTFGVPVDSVPRVLLRVDDNSPNDAAFINRMQARGLYGELAVPTSSIGRDGRPSWNELRLHASQGFTIVAHSRHHSQATRTDLEFMGEVLGSLNDLAVEGLGTTVFVQPGVWTDSLSFDSEAKLRGWRGALLKTFTSVFEAYVYSVPRPITADSLALGFGHYTLSSDPAPTRINQSWQQATAKNRATVFLVHTWQLPNPDALNWFLDTLAAARQAGRIRLMRSARQVFYP